uniref:Uncharacterized protein n=1 Tax=Nonomuraea gerenzanensis TaxID=93944 RepID=A0A1M4E3L4_9ACTN|nr:hypothetical protein BN4615_P2878 [Nonomuraea gerenzanensis]
MPAPTGLPDAWPHHMDRPARAGWIKPTWEASPGKGGLPRRQTGLVWPGRLNLLSPRSHEQHLCDVTAARCGAVALSAIKLGREGPASGQFDLIPDEAAVLRDFVVQVSCRVVRLVGVPVHTRAAALPRPVADSRDQRAPHALAPHLRSGEQILQVADIGVGRGGAPVGEEVGDADQLAVQSGAQGVQTGVRLEFLPCPFVHLVRFDALVEVDVRAEQALPCAPVGGEEPADIDHVVLIGGAARLGTGRARTYAGFLDLGLMGKGTGLIRQLRERRWPGVRPLGCDTR